MAMEYAANHLNDRTPDDPRDKIFQSLAEARLLNNHSIRHGAVGSVATVAKLGCLEPLAMLKHKTKLQEIVTARNQELSLTQRTAWPPSEASDEAARNRNGTKSTARGTAPTGRRAK